MDEDFKNEDYENAHVHKFYSQHASDFNVTRVKTWPKIESFLNLYDKPGYVNLDAGCGNGRNLPKYGGLWIGLDFSRELLECIISKRLGERINSLNNSNNKNNESDNLIRTQNYPSHKNNSDLNKNLNCDLISLPSLVRGDVLNLPFKDKSFDIILSIAVIHHFSTKERRKKALIEMGRILKDKGRILLYVWNEDTKRKSKFKQINDKDYLVKFNGVFDRYYYLYDQQELVDFCKENGFIVEESGIEQESIYVILIKI